MEDKFLVDLLDSKYRESLERFKDNKHTHEDLTIMMLKHQTNHIEHLEIDLNEKIDGLGTRIDKLDTRIDKLDTRIDKLDTRIRNQTWQLLAGVAAIVTIFAVVEKLI